MPRSRAFGGSVYNSGRILAVRRLARHDAVLSRDLAIVSEAWRAIHIGPWHSGYGSRNGSARVMEAELEAKIAAVRARIVDLKFALPTVLASHDNRVLGGLANELRVRTQELATLENELKRLRIETREEVW